MPRRVLAAVLPLLCVLPLAACGGPAASSAAYPTVSGSYGSAPKLTFPNAPAPTRLEVKVLKRGSGPVVGKDTLLVANYLGQTWRGKVFDSSWGRGTPAAFPIGTGQVIAGWDKTLVGQRAGSRVELVIPPADGYGSQGQPQAGIGPHATLAFVVDIIASYGKDAHADTNATPQPVAAKTPKVTGALGSSPTITIPKGTPPPTKVSTYLLAKGTGAPITKGLLVVQYAAVDWTGKLLQSTWHQGIPAGVTVTGASGSQAGPLDALIGVPVGSRVLIDVPPTTTSSGAKANPATASNAIVIDVVAQPT